MAEHELTLDELAQTFEALRLVVLCHPEEVEAVRSAVTDAGVPLVDVVPNRLVDRGGALVCRPGLLLGARP